ncbi:MAG: glycosyltransferase family 2 protein [Anaerolineales bacterium]|nr:glycosyltransferase family 2 protein [Anaerolineales bacterium]MDW8227543.1 glycosyltransferase [Anaerolineales bacterium]
MLPFTPHEQFVLLFLLFGLVTALVNLFTIRRFDQYPRASHWPRVSVLVPARNEELNIEACVASLLAQDYPDFEVLVLDDHSSDATPQILNRLASQDSRLRVLHGAPLPKGWLGKHWACHQLAQAAEGELFLFTDADTRHAPDMLQASVSALLAERADLVTAFPRQEVVTWGEKLIVPFMAVGILTFLPLRLARHRRWAALSVTIGQFMLFRREAYERVGGYEAVRSALVDDVYLGRRVVQSGGRWRFLDGTSHVSCRMYRDFWGAVNGFGKSIFAVFGYRVLPYLLAWTLLTIVFLEPPLALVAHWVGYPFTLFSPEAAALAIALTFILWNLAYRRFKFPHALALLYPVQAFLFLLVALRSFVQTASGTATWKDRILERPALRWL